MPRWVATVLEAPITSLIGRIALTFVFWATGIVHTVRWGPTVDGMERLGLNPPEVVNLATIVVFFVGSALVIWGPWAWIGAGMLAVFLALTIPIAHPFWTMDPPQRFARMNIVLEHVSVIGGLILAAVLRHKERPPTR